MKLLIFITFIFQSSQSFAGNDFLYVKKSEKLMIYYKDGVEHTRYKIALGDQPKGHKQQEGDERTPEGIYKITWKKENSQFYRALYINYPNKHDKKNAKDLGVSPGGNIFIHGLPNNMDDWVSNFPKYIQDWIMGSGTKYHYLYNWTDGCIAVTNDEMKELWDLIKLGTYINIEY